MNTPFNSSTEVINACNAECERAWNNFVITKKLNENKSPEAPRAIAAAKDVFRHGYFAGAHWVSKIIVAQTAVEKMANEEADTLLKNFPPTQSKV